MTDPTDLPAGTTWGDVARLFDEAANDPHATDEERRQNAKTRDEIVAKGPNFSPRLWTSATLGGASPRGRRRRSADKPASAA
jgi:hypothetical protein